VLCQIIRAVVQPPSRLGAPRGSKTVGLPKTAKTVENGRA